MGFWKGLWEGAKAVGKTAGDLMNEVAKNAQEDPTSGYNLGKLDGSLGQPSKYHDYQRAGSKPEWLDAYSRGYIAGREERRASGKG